VHGVDVVSKLGYSANRRKSPVLSLKQTDDAMPDRCFHDFIGCRRKSMAIQYRITDLQGAIRKIDLIQLN